MQPLRGRSARVRDACAGARRARRALYEENGALSILAAESCGGLAADSAAARERGVEGEAGPFGRDLFQSRYGNI